MSQMMNIIFNLILFHNFLEKEKKGVKINKS